MLPDHALDAKSHTNYETMKDCLCQRPGSEVMMLVGMRRSLTALVGSKAPLHTSPVGVAADGEDLHQHEAGDEATDMGAVSHTT